MEDKEKQILDLNGQISKVTNNIVEANNQLEDMKVKAKEPALQRAKSIIKVNFFVRILRIMSISFFISLFLFLEN
jgi:hypothetical protein